tara:strand:+ start:304 stop:612 length:309 start_codon:yes stop_codon:yes gene_type:complete
MYFKGGGGIEKPQDINGQEIKEGSIITFDWFDSENPIEDMRRKFTSMKEWTNEQISERIHKPTFNVKLNEKGILFGEGIEEREHDRRLYLHDFRFKYTKLVL